MKYENAADVLPADLLRRVQKFAAGKLIYIPEAGTKSSWGEASGMRDQLAGRNHEIREKHQAGVAVADLAGEYGLSPDSIKKIVYSRAVPPLKYQRTLASAEQFAREGRVEEWVHAYLLSDGHNKPFSDGLKLCPRYYHGPVTMPLSLLTRCCGPEVGMEYPEEEEWFDKRVKALRSAIESGGDLPPLIVNYTKGALTLNDGNHRHEAFRRAGVEEYPVILWATEKEDYDKMLEWLEEKEP